MSLGLGQNKIFLTLDIGYPKSLSLDDAYNSKVFQMRIKSYSVESETFPFLQFPDAQIALVIDTKTNVHGSQFDKCIQKIAGTFKL